MGKRKLRSCANCGGRHGPPTGKLCTHAEDEFARKNEEMQGEVGAAAGPASIIGAVGPAEEEQSWALSPGEQLEWDFPAYPEADGSKKEPPKEEEVEEKRPIKFNFTGGPTSAEHNRSDGARQAPAPAAMAAGGPEVPRRSRFGLSNFERILSDRVMRVENAVETMAATTQAQQGQIERLITLLSDQTGRGGASMSRATEAAAAARPSNDSESSESSADEWQEYLGPKLWKQEKDKARKNPFDQRSYGKKGDVIDSFEKLMVITFKTLRQFLENKYDLKGLVRHGLSLTEKAAKDVYRPEAFVKYDESVRDRAAHDGPTAFNSVEQEDVLRFFCYDSVKHKKTSGGASGKSGAPQKREKICLRYNDGGCTSKNCPYAHKCIACEEWGHPRKECKSLKKKDAK